jgi:hypothetical protein
VVRKKKLPDLAAGLRNRTRFEQDVVRSRDLDELFLAASQQSAGERAHSEQGKQR